MSRYKTTTRATTTTTHQIDLPGATLDDLRKLVEATVHLGAGSPIQSDMFGITLAVHETRIDKEAE